MIDTLGNMPAHPLLVHVPVVLVPLATIGVVALALRPALLRTLGPIVAGLAGVGFVGALLATSSGESLEDSYAATGQTISTTIKDHAEMGDQARLAILAFFVVTLAWVVVTARRRRAATPPDTTTRRAPTRVVGALMVLSVLSGVVATTWVIRTGHSGASSVWEKSSDG